MMYIQARIKGGWVGYSLPTDIRINYKTTENVTCMLVLKASRNGKVIASQQTIL